MRINFNIDKEISPRKPLVPPPYSVPSDILNKVLKQSSNTLLNLQHPDGYWWFTLEANETIGAEFILLMHFLGEIDPAIQTGVINRILQVQREDGSWGLYHTAPGDLSATVECYFSLRLAGFSPDAEPLQKAKKFILENGGLTEVRVFTRIHLALFGLIPWELCPIMPPEMILLPPWAPVNIYHFSSWARASIVPLLVILNKKPVVKLNGINLEELYKEPPDQRKWAPSRKTSPLSIERLFLVIDKGLKYLDRVPFKPWRPYTFEKAIDWVWEHMQKTEDIYPALAYGAMAFKAFGLPNDSIQIQTALKALKSFQQKYDGDSPPALPFFNEEVPSPWSTVHGPSSIIHQQCCISPVWDTPWALVALLETDLIKPHDKRLLKAGRWLLSKEVTNPNGDWRFKNPDGIAGGWSFEFKNEYFPDVDDTIEVLTTLQTLPIPEEEKKPAMDRGLAWLLSMQNDDGGWGAFDKNNDLDLLNKIPFSDHGACLDPSTPDITGRAIELLMKLGTSPGGMSPNEKILKKAIRFLKKSQEHFGGWYGRWGVNYIYGTWTVLTALETLGKENPLVKESRKACQWLKSIQNEDGGFSESPESYVKKKFLPYPESVPSQTAWAVMGLVA
ncbi:MAG: squalene--hopene cyclase, partial [Deltaproteobacteria bacterium]|nr:squalene--hopene cyclase [Deltaproteobacteria bacterium]